MSSFEAFRLALEAIVVNKLRSFLTLLGVIFGVATVIVVVSLIEGFNRYVDEKIADIGTNAFSVQKYSIEDFSSVESLEKARRRNKDITLEDLAALRAHGGAIGPSGGKAAGSGDLKYGDQTVFAAEIRATSASMADIDRVEMAAGRYFTDGEEQANRAVCVIGSDVADRLFATSDPVGKILRVDGRPYQIIGIAAPLGSVFGQSRDNFVAVPLSTFLTSYGSRRSISLIVTSTSAATYDDAVDEARVLMRTRRKLKPNEPDNFGVVTPKAINELREKIFGTIQTAAVGVTSIALLVGGIVIMNIMLVSVTERTREIGIRKSLGARQRDILKQFLFESTLLAFSGGAAGVAIAFLLAKAVSTFTPMPTMLPWAAVAIALFVSASVGMISGMYPAWKAARLSPIVALRAE